MWGIFFEGWNWKKRRRRWRKQIFFSPYSGEFCPFAFSAKSMLIEIFQAKIHFMKGQGGGMSENTLLPSSISLVSAGRPLSPASAWKNDGMKSLLEAWFFCCLWSVLFPFYPFLPEPPVYGERFSPWSRHLERSNCLVPWLSVASCQKSLNRIYWHQIYSVHSTYQQSNKDNRFSEWYTRLYQTWVCAKHFHFCI